MEIQVNTPQSVAVDTASYLSSNLSKYLNHGSVLLFISGGSVASAVVPLLLVQLSQMPLILRRRLTVCLGDDRYGLPNHPDSNMYLLKKNRSAKLFKKSGIRYVYPLNKTANSLAEAVSKFETTLKQIITTDKPKLISVLGIGVDGHTAGIKPLSDEGEFNRIFCSQTLVVGYHAVDFTRITVTLSLLKQNEQIVLFAVGKEKTEVLKKLNSAVQSKLHEFPAGIIKKIAKSILFTDQNIS